jgi:hypothetical protein
MGARALVEAAGRVCAVELTWPSTGQEIRSGREGDMQKNRPLLKRHVATIPLHDLIRSFLIRHLFIRKTRKADVPVPQARERMTLRSEHP